MKHYTILLGCLLCSPTFLCGMDAGNDTNTIKGEYYLKGAIDVFTNIYVESLPKNTKPLKKTLRRALSIKGLSNILKKKSLEITPKTSIRENMELPRSRSVSPSLLGKTIQPLPTAPGKSRSNSLNNSLPSSILKPVPSRRGRSLARVISGKFSKVKIPKCESSLDSEDKFVLFGCILNHVMFGSANPTQRRTMINWISKGPYKNKLQQETGPFTMTLFLQELNKVIDLTYSPGAFAIARSSDKTLFLKQHPDYTNKKTAELEETLKMLEAKRQGEFYMLEKENNIKLEPQEKAALKKWKALSTFIHQQEQEAMQEIERVKQSVFTNFQDLKNKKRKGTL